MSVCIKSNLFNFDKIILTEEKEYSVQKEEKEEKEYSLQNEEKYSFKKRNILYKYDLNIFKQLQVLTNYIDVLKCFNKYDKLKIIISDPNIIDIYNLIQNKINSDKTVICDTKSLDLYFINNVSELTLHPSKKSNLSQYKLTKIENSNQIKRYFPCINKNLNDLNDELHVENIHSGKFLLKFEIINNKLKCIIINGELKYSKSYIKSELQTTNVYQSNITIEL